MSPTITPWLSVAVAPSTSSSSLPAPWLRGSSDKAEGHSDSSGTWSMSTQKRMLEKNDESDIQEAEGAIDPF